MFSACLYVVPQLWQYYYDLYIALIYRDTLICMTYFSPILSCILLNIVLYIFAKKFINAFHICDLFLGLVLRSCVAAPLPCWLCCGFRAPLGVHSSWVGPTSPGKGAVTVGLSRFRAVHSWVPLPSSRGRALCVQQPLRAALQHFRLGICGCPTSGQSGPQT